MNKLIGLFLMMNSVVKIDFHKLETNFNFVSDMAHVYYVIFLLYYPSFYSG